MRARFHLPGRTARPSIPKIIHQTWKTGQVPESLRMLADSWRRLHPDWEYRLWTDERNRAFIQIHYPEFLPRYDAYPHPIQRVDAVRYFLLHRFGGMYVDLDMECLRPIGPLLEKRSCVFGLEPDEHCAIHGKPRILGNAWMASTPGHPFFGHLLTELAESTISLEHRNNQILETTGPFMLTRVYERSRPAGVSLIPGRRIYPFTLDELERTARQGWSRKDLGKRRGAYAVHYFQGSWWKPQPA